MNICTIVAKNYIAHARVLAESFREHHPEGRCFVLVVDETEGYLNPANEPFELIRPSDLDIDDYEHMAGIYDVVELSTSVKPWLLSHLLNDRGLDHIVYFDPDIRICDRLDRLADLIDEYELVLTPHVTSPMPRDGKKPSEADILIAGTYNLGFIAVKRCARTQKLLDWWAERLRTDCVVAPELGYFVDQRWIDFIHGVMPGFYVLNDPGYNVAYWNLHGREVTFKNGRYEVNGEPLQFFHFSGYDPRTRQRLSKHQSRIELKAGSALKRICDEYAEALLANGFEKVKDWPYTYGTLPNGVKLDSSMHRLYRSAAEAGELRKSIFAPEGAREFVAWLNEPAVVGGQHGVTRYLYEIYAHREDLRQAFPNLEGSDAAALIEWARVHADLHLSLSHHPSADGNGWHPTGSTTGINVAGYFRSELGVGEVARQMIGALDTQNIPHATVGIPTPHSRQGHDFETDTVEPAYPVNLICVNADALPDFASTAGARLFENRYSIGMWWWEVSEFPERLTNAFEHLDEVWVGSHHVGDAIASVSPIPVVKVTMPVSMPEIKELTREELGLPEDFLFLFVFDYHSIFERKNPLAAIEAFKKAFPRGSGASLVVKSINGENYPEQQERLRAATEGRPDIHVVDRYVSVDEKNAMIAACDCYVSLHRSEGFGITLAEAMYLEKPVIATAYSGNMDFMTDRNGYLVDYELTSIGEGSEPYPPTGEWAEPDTEHAADLMRRVFDDQEEARLRGTRAATDIRRTHSPEAAGRVIARRLTHVEDRLRGPQPAEVQASSPQPGGLNVDPLVHRIASTPQPVASGSLPGRAMGLARRVSLKLNWPFAMQQRTINDQLLTMIKGVDDSLRSSVGRLGVQIAKNQAEVAGAASKLEVIENKLESSLDATDKYDARIKQLEASRANVLGAINQQNQRIKQSAASGGLERQDQQPEELHQELERLRPELAPASSGTSVRQTISRWFGNSTEQQTINDQLFAAIVTISEKLHKQREAIHQQQEAIQRNTRSAEASDRLVAETRAIPYMADSPFEVFEDPAAGSVFGYTNQNGSSKSAGVYDAFEDIFRGSEDFIRDRQRRYLDVLNGHEPVLDVGCGRGEFLDILRDEGIEYSGIDLDPDMVERCRRKGHKDVQVADANSYLEKQEDGSLGVIFSAQVIEHIPYEDLLRFFELSQRKLKPGGLFIVETVNPHSVAAMKAFWVDLSHQHPIFPEVTLALCKINGFEAAYAFHPNGTGDVEKDRYETGEYAVVATKATQR